MTMPPKLLVSFGIFFFFKFSVGDGKWCDSPQFIELAKKGTVFCSLGGVYAISWYNSTILRNKHPIIHCKNLIKSGSGYASGEFDICPNGSLVINNVSLKHDHYFTVEYLQSQSSEPIVINVDVTVIVKPQLGFPAVDGCNNVSGICFRNIDRHNLSCSVELVRPRIRLRWTTKTVFGDKNISFSATSESDGKMFTSRVSTTDSFKYTSRLALAACTAHTLPEMLETNEYLILLQNSNQKTFNAEPIVRYVERYSKMALPCTNTSIGFLTWWKVDLSSRRFNHPLLYAVLIGNRRNEILEKGFEMGSEGSLIIPQVDIEYQGIYSCIYSDGVTDGITGYEIIVYAYPIPNHLVIQGCNHDRYCVLEVEKEGNLTCSVYGIRPKVQLYWMAFKEQQPITFKPQERLIVEGRGTFDISLSSAYNSNFKAGDRVTVLCKMTNPVGVPFDMATTIDLIFSKERQELTTIEVIDESHLATNNDTTIIFIITIIVPVLLITVVLFVVIIKVSRNKRQNLKRDINKTEEIESMPLALPADDNFEDMKTSLIKYLEVKNDYLLEAIDRRKDIPYKELQEILRQLCFMGVEISIEEALQESAISLLKIATKNRIYIKSVSFVESFYSVDLSSSSIVTKSHQTLSSNTNFTQLHIKYGNKRLEAEDLRQVKRLFIFASKCPRLKIIKFTNCGLPLRLDDIMELKNLEKHKVEVHWENNVLLPKYVLNLSDGYWENDGDGCQLNDNDYNHLMTFFSDEVYSPGYLHITKGARSYSPRQMVQAQKIFKTMVKVFNLHGAETIDTPLFESKEMLFQHFDPEYSRLLYYLNDQGNESVSLRFDLTIPFVRYLVMNNVTKMKRYHIGKVYRRESKVMKGRRCGEFYQCDFDIAGKYDQMVPDAECILIVCTILKKLNIGKFIVKVNHQKVLEGLSELLNVPKKNIAKISDLIENNPQSSTADIRRIVKDKQINYGKDLAKLLEYLKIKGGRDKIHNLLKDEHLVRIEHANKGLQDLQLLFQFCDVLGVVEQVQFEMDLTRSLGYYSGLVFEAVLEVPRLHMDKGFKNRGILANGGRYDDVITKLTRGKKTVPCVGFTFDFEQLFTLLEYRERNTEIPTKATEVLVISNNHNMELLKLCRELWDSGVKAEIADMCYEKATDDDQNVAFIVCLTKKESDRVVIVTTSTGEKVHLERSNAVSFIMKQLPHSKEQNLAPNEMENQETDETNL